MNEEIEVIYPSDEEIVAQVNLIVNHSSKKQTIMAHVDAWGQSLYMIRVYLLLEKCFDSFLRLFDIRYMFQQYLEVIVIGIMLIFGLLVPSTS